MGWSRTLHNHVDVLRHALLKHREVWPEVAEQAGFAFRTIRGFACNRQKTYKNPCIGTLTKIAQALEAAIAEEQDGVI